VSQCPVLQSGCGRLRNPAFGASSARIAGPKINLDFVWKPTRNVSYLKKLHRRVIVRSVVVLGLAATTRAQISSEVASDAAVLEPNKKSATAVRSVADGTDFVRARTFVGRAVRDRDGKLLGSVKDAYLTTHSGKSVYLAVTSPSDDSLRLVPFAAVRQPGLADALTLNVAAKDWEQLPPASVVGIDAARLAISASDGQLLAQLFDESVREVASGAQLVASSELRGKSVSTGTDNVGTIDDVVIDNRGEAAAVITPGKEFAGTDGKLVVPVHRLNLGTRDLSPIRTDLARSDFEKRPRSVNTPPP
jgi:sporulation protein YlmC with PRC-barrel domain